MAGHAAGRSRTGKTPRIYVASLSDYNAGRLHGAWIPAIDADEARDLVEAMLRASRQPGAEEFATHDFEGVGSYRVHEHDGLELTCAVGAAIEELGPLFADYLAHVGTPRGADDVAHLMERFGKS